jgi:hypothetical protein
VLKQKLLLELHDSESRGHIGYASTLAKALDMFWWRRIRQDVNDHGQRCDACRRAKERPQTDGALVPLHVPPRPWHTVGLDFLSHLLQNARFDNMLVVVDHLTRMAHFFPKP